MNTSDEKDAEMRAAEREEYMGDKARGLYQKFIVERTDGKSAIGQKHDGCDYFVLDMTHDKFALAAVTAYANACESEYPLLAADIRSKYQCTEYAKSQVGVERDVVGEIWAKFQDKETTYANDGEPTETATITQSELGDAVDSILTHLAPDQPVRELVWLVKEYLSWYDESRRVESDGDSLSQAEAHTEEYVALERLRAALANVNEPKVCEWKWNDEHGQQRWMASCGAEYYEYYDGYNVHDFYNPQEQDHRHCGRCGFPIKEVK